MLMLYLRFSVIFHWKLQMLLLIRWEIIASAQLCNSLQVSGSCFFYSESNNIHLKEDFRTRIVNMQSLLVSLTESDL